MHTLQTRSVIAPGVFLGFLNWEDVLDLLREIDSISLNQGQQMVIADSRKLLLKKGFLRYKGFSKDIHSKKLAKTKINSIVFMQPTKKLHKLIGLINTYTRRNSM